MERDVSSCEVAGLTWDRVGERLAAGTRAILPIGAGAKEHGLHMPMATDQVFADYFARVLAENIDALNLADPHLWRLSRFRGLRGKHQRQRRDLHSARHRRRHH